MISIKNLNKSFEEHIIFRDFSLEIPDKTFAVFTGSSGCGKTTLLNMIAGIEPIDEGEIVVNDIAVSKARNLQKYYREQLGLLFQNFALVDQKTVLENLNMVQKGARSDITIEEALKRVEMSGKENQRVYSLSGGEQQRIAMARLMIKKCDVILADEPTGALDRENALDIMRILKSFQEMGKTVIMVTHDVSLIDDSMLKIQLKPYKNPEPKNPEPK